MTTGSNTRTSYGHIPTELVNMAVDDLANGNRPMTSRAYLQRRLAEISYDRTQENEAFEEWKKVFFTVGAWERNWGNK